MYSNSCAFSFASWLHLPLHGALLLRTNFSFFSHLLIMSAIPAIPDALEEEGGTYEPLYSCHVVDGPP